MFSSTLCSSKENLNVCSSLSVRYQVSHPYKPKGKTVLLYVSIFGFAQRGREDKMLIRMAANVPGI
jgi:hypothetical protein